MEPRIAELLVRETLITREQLQEAVDKQKRDGAHLVQELVRSGYTTEEKLIDFFAQRFGIEKNYNSVMNASMKSSGAVPEPHEWMLIALVFLVAIYLWKKPF